MEQQEGLTPTAAILHFGENHFRGLFKRKHGEKPPEGYAACWAAINDAKNGEVSFDRARGLLEKYAPGKYLFKLNIQAL